MTRYMWASDCRHLWPQWCGEDMWNLWQWATKNGNLPNVKQSVHMSTASPSVMMCQHRPSGCGFCTPTNSNSYSFNCQVNSVICLLSNKHEQIQTHQKIVRDCSNLFAILIHTNSHFAGVQKPRPHRHRAKDSFFETILSGINIPYSLPIKPPYCVQGNPKVWLIKKNLSPEAFTRSWHDLGMMHPIYMSSPLITYCNWLSSRVIGYNWQPPCVNMHH